MSTKILLFFLLIFFIASQSFSQKSAQYYFDTKGEVYFQFELTDRTKLESLTKIISIANVKKQTVFAYANKDEFNHFLELRIKYTILPHPGDVENVTMTNSIDGMDDWNTYPTYDAYVSMMYQFQTDFGNICQIVDAGTTVQGRHILFAVISDNIGSREAEPQFMFTSSIHGNETTGYVLMLRLIDSLLTSYGYDNRITNLVDNVEIWINPLANPDGTYHSGNNTVSGATRYNANGYDLNRNFPDPEDGMNPGGPWQPETIVMMNIAEANNFVLSANFHGGVEVMNYPWDTWIRRHADDNWLQLVSRQYADTAHAHSPSGYMTFMNNGITNGYDWYTISGGRQDYMTYFRHGREITMEISDSYILPASQLPAFWEYNKRSFLNYIEQTLYGIRGVVTDTVGNPIRAKVLIAGHDLDSSEVYSDSINGNYHRMIFAGNYNLTFTAPHYFDTTITGVSVANKSTTILNVEMIPLEPVPVELISFNANVQDGKVNLFWSTATEINNQGFEIQRKLENSEWTLRGFKNGAGTTTEPQSYSFSDDITDVNAKSIYYRLKQIDFDGSYEYSDEVFVTNLTPTKFVLEQNYPNPFNPTTTIKYSIAGEGIVTLKVFNTIGEEVALLVNETKLAGNYEVEFDASGLSSGIYLYRLHSGNFVQTRKMLLLK